MMSYEFYKQMEADHQAPNPAANNNVEREPRQRSQCNTAVLYIIVIYLFMTMSNNVSINRNTFSQDAGGKLKGIGESPSVKNTLRVFESGASYQGSWSSTGKSVGLSKEEGKFHMFFYKYLIESKEIYSIEFIFKNGKYVDEGELTFRFALNETQLRAYKNGSLITISSDAVEENTTNETKEAAKDEIKAIYEYDMLLKTIEEKIIVLDSVQFRIDYNEKSGEVSAEVQIDSKEISVISSVSDYQSVFLPTVLFALLLFVVSFVEFSGILDMLRGVFEGTEGANVYSMYSILMATMWDAAVCIIAFVEAFRREENLILFIIPAFVLCLLFTNLELRFLLMIFQTRADNQNIREVICKFNLLTYGSLILIYPILIITNLRWFLFIALSLIFLPQIYLNAINGHRPNLSSSYYTKFLPVRFLLILYVKCFPWNIFEIEPNYLLTTICILLVASQYFLLRVQKIYGAKKVLPSFLLPPVFDYGKNLDIDVELGENQMECSICLMPLQSEPDQILDYHIPYKIMTAPCSHSFHGPCLAKWMQIKMECPQCRGPLPAFE